jgi:hypothetical protein
MGGRVIFLCCDGVVVKSTAVRAQGRGMRPFMCIASWLWPAEPAAACRWVERESNQDLGSGQRPQSADM